MLKNILWTVSSRYGAQALAILSNVWLARVLGADGFGEYALASAVLLVGNAFTNFGMDMILIRKLSVTDVPWLLIDGLGGQLFLSVVYVGGIFFAGEFWPIPPLVKLYTLALFPLSFYSIFTIAVRARGQLALYSLAQLLVAGLQFLAVLFLWASHGDGLAFITTMLIGHVLAALWTGGHQQFRLEFLSPVRSFSLLKECFSMAVIGTLRLVYEKLPVTFLPVLSGYTATGLFSSALRVMDAGKLGHFSAFTAIYPEMTRNAEFGRELKGWKTLLGTAFLIAVLLFLFSEPIIYILFGASFITVVPLLKILAWLVIPYVVVTYTSLGLVAMNIERPVLVSLVMTVLLLSFLLFLFSRFFGTPGAAAAVLVAECFHAALLSMQWRFHARSKLP